MPRKSSSDIWVAAVSFVAVIDKVEERVQKGDRVREGAKILSAHRGLFKPAEDGIRFAPEIEQATAAPGEKRA